MNRSVLVNTLLLVSLTLTGCGSVPTKAGFCPSSAFIDPKRSDPPPKSYEEFKLWAGKVYGNESKLVDSYSTLRECWDFYHPVAQ